MLLTNLKALRMAREITQTTLAEQVSASPAMISRLESGDRLPSFGLACRLAFALGVALDDLTYEPERNINMQSEDRSSRRLARRNSGQYIEDRRKRRQRKIARKLGLVPGRRSDLPNITLISRDDLDKFGPD